MAKDRNTNEKSIGMSTRNEKDGYPRRDKQEVGANPYKSGDNRCCPRCPSLFCRPRPTTLFVHFSRRSVPRAASTKRNLYRNFCLRAWAIGIWEARKDSDPSVGRAIWGVFENPMIDRMNEMLRIVGNNLNSPRKLYNLYLTSIYIYIESIYAQVKLNVKDFSPHVSNINGKTREIYNTARPWGVKEINESVYSHFLNLQLFFHQSYRYRVDNKYFIVEITAKYDHAKYDRAKYDRAAMNVHIYSFLEKWNK